MRQSIGTLAVSPQDPYKIFLTKESMFFVPGKLGLYIKLVFILKKNYGNVFRSVFLLHERWS